MPKIERIYAREVLDSRGNPTVEAVVATDSCCASAIVPSGASTGVHEALELRDGKSRLKDRYDGRGVLKAVKNINKIISKALKGEDCTEQEQIDKKLIEMDGTENKSRLGANSLLAVSMAVCKAGSYSTNNWLFSRIRKLANKKLANKMPKKPIMPIPLMNIINSGKHAGLQNDIQEHMIAPVKFKSFKESLRAGTETYHALGKILKEKFGHTAMLLGDEGGFAPKIGNIEQRLELMLEAIKKAGYSKKIKLALDCAASEFYDRKSGHYTLLGQKYSKEELVGFYKNLVAKYPVFLIEDGMSQDDWEGWNLLNKELGKKVQIVGDDLLVSNIKRIRTALEKSACNSLLLKVNQIGTVTEAIEAANLAAKNSWNVIVSHRSGETEDTFIADLAVGLQAGQCKFGAPARGERTAKYNQLLRIEEELKG